MVEGDQNRENGGTNSRNVGFMVAREEAPVRGTGLNLRWQMGSNIDGPTGADWECCREKSPAIWQQWAGRIKRLESSSGCRKNLSTDP